MKKKSGRDGDLWRLLVKACPPYRGEKSIRVLAEKLGVSHQTIYYWTTNGKLPPDKALAIAKFGLVRLSELEKWVYGCDVGGVK